MTEDALLAFEASAEEVQALLEVGQVYYLRGEYGKAEKVFRGVLHLSPGNGDIHAALGATYHVQGKTDLALECYEQALQACPSESCAKANRGELMLLGGDRDAAVRELKDTIEREGEDSPLGERAAALLKVAEAAAEQEQQ